MFDQYGMHMPSDRLLKHRQTKIYNKAIERQIRQIYVNMAERYKYIEFIMYGGEREAMA